MPAVGIDASSRGPLPLGVRGTSTHGADDLGADSSRRTRGGHGEPRSRWTSGGRGRARSIRPKGHFAAGYAAEPAQAEGALRRELAHRVEKRPRPARLALERLREADEVARAAG